MHRIDTKTAQKDKFGAGKNGFTRGNPQTGTPATDLDDDYFDMLQEELCSVVEASGASLEKARHDQLLYELYIALQKRFPDQSLNVLSLQLLKCLNEHKPPLYKRESLQDSWREFGFIPKYDYSSGRPELTPALLRVTIRFLPGMFPSD